MKMLMRVKTFACAALLGALTLSVSSAFGEAIETVAYWNRDFGTTAKGGYSLSLGANATINADGTVGIKSAKTSGTGLEINFFDEQGKTAFAGNDMTVIVKYSGLTLNTGAYEHLFATIWGDSKNAAETLVVHRYGNRSFVFSGATSESAGTSTTLSTSVTYPSSGLMMISLSGGHDSSYNGVRVGFAPLNDDGTYGDFVQFGSADAATVIGGFYGIKIGGSKCNSFYRPAMKVEGVAIIKGFTTTMKTFKYLFPDECVRYDCAGTIPTASTKFADGLSVADIADGIFAAKFTTSMADWPEGMVCACQKAFPGDGSMKLQYQVRDKSHAKSADVTFSNENDGIYFLRTGGKYDGTSPDDKIGTDDAGWYRANTYNFKDFSIYVPAAARIGEKTYLSLAAAEAEVQTGETITLVQDSAEALMTAKSFTLKLNGFDYTGALTIEEGGVVTIDAPFTANLNKAFLANTTGDGTLKMTFSNKNVELLTTASALTANVNVEYCGTGHLEFRQNASNTPSGSFTIAAGKTVTLADGTFWNKRCEFIVNGTLLAKDLMIGHESNGNYPGKVTINDGGIVKVGKITFRNGGGTAGGDYDSVLDLQPGGVLEFTQNETVAIARNPATAKYAVNLNGGTLKADESSWRVGTDVALNLAADTVFSAAEGNTITLESPISGAGKVFVEGKGTLMLGGTLPEDFEINVKDGAGIGALLTDDGFATRNATLVLDPATDGKVTVAIGGNPQPGMSYPLFAAGITEEDLERLLIDASCELSLVDGILSVKLVPQTLMWTGAGLDGLWSTTANWSGGTRDLGPFDSVGFDGNGEVTTMDKENGLQLTKIIVYSGSWTTDVATASFANSPVEISPGASFALTNAEEVSNPFATAADANSIAGVLDLGGGSQEFQIAGDKGPFKDGCELRNGTFQLSTEDQYWAFAEGMSFTLGSDAVLTTKRNCRMSFSGDFIIDGGVYTNLFAQGAQSHVISKNQMSVVNGGRFVGKTDVYLAYNNYNKATLLIDNGTFELPRGKFLYLGNNPSTAILAVTNGQVTAGNVCIAASGSPTVRATFVNSVILTDAIMTKASVGAATSFMSFDGVTLVDTGDDNNTLLGDIGIPYTVEQGGLTVKVGDRTDNDATITLAGTFDGAGAVTLTAAGKKPKAVNAANVIFPGDVTVADGITFVREIPEDKTSVTVLSAKGTITIPESYETKDAQGKFYFVKRKNGVSVLRYGYNMGLVISIK